MAIAGRVVGVSAWPALLGVEISEPVIGGAALAVIAAIGLFMRSQMTSRKYIREAADVHETVRTELVGQPLRVKAELEFVPMQRFTQLEADVQRREHEILQHVQAIESKGELRRAETDDSFEALRVQIDAKVQQAISASNSSASKIHQRLDNLAETLATARGESKSTNEQVGEIRRMLMDRGTERRS